MILNMKEVLKIKISKFYLRGGKVPYLEPMSITVQRNVQI